jgi:hypothetical protein
MSLETVVRTAAPLAIPLALVSLLRLLSFLGPLVFDPSSYPLQHADIYQNLYLWLNGSSPAASISAVDVVLTKNLIRGVVTARRVPRGDWVLQIPARFVLSARTFSGAAGLVKAVGDWEDTFDAEFFVDTLVLVSAAGGKWLLSPSISSTHPSPPPSHVTVP